MQFHLSSDMQDPESDETMAMAERMAHAVVAEEHHVEGVILEDDDRTVRLFCSCGAIKDSTDEAAEHDAEAHVASFAAQPEHDGFLAVKIAASLYEEARAHFGDDLTPEMMLHAAFGAAESIREREAAELEAAVFGDSPTSTDDGASGGYL